MNLGNQHKYLAQFKILVNIKNLKNLRAIVTQIFKIKYFSYFFVNSYQINDGKLNVSIFNWSNHKFNPLMFIRAINLIKESKKNKKFNL